MISKKSGHIFERSLVLKYVEEEGKCPITGAEMSREDLVEINTHGATKPRVSTTSSVPGLLATFQNEWDALMLETFHLKKNLNTVRKELSQSLYQYDAACRVIARLVKERDEARRALSQMGGSSATSSSSTNNNNSNDAMDVDEEKKSNNDAVEGGLPQNVLSDIENVSSKLSKGRKKRPKPSTLPKKDVMKTFVRISKSKIRSAKSNCLDLHTDENLIVLGDRSGSIRLFDKKTNKALGTMKGHKKAVTTVSFDRVTKDRDVFYSTSEDATVRMWTRSSAKKYDTVAELSDLHTDTVTDLSIHPTGRYVATCSKDGSWAFHEVVSKNDKEFEFQTHLHIKGNGDVITALQFHPDGALVAIGTESGRLDVYQLKSVPVAKPAVSLNLDGPVTSLSFSENGYFLACGQTSSVKLFDLRKPEASMTAHDEKLEDGETLSQVRFDISGTYLAVATSNGVTTRHAKSWKLLAKFDDERSGKSGVSGVVFASDSTFVVSCGVNGELAVSSST